MTHVKQNNSLYKDLKYFILCSASDPPQRNEAIRPNCHQGTEKKPRTVNLVNLGKGVICHLLSWVWMPEKNLFCLFKTVFTSMSFCLIKVCTLLDEGYFVHPFASPTGPSVISSSEYVFHKCRRNWVIFNIVE